MLTKQLTEGYEILAQQDDGLFSHLTNFQSDTQNGVLPRKSTLYTVCTGINAFTREIEQSKHAHSLSKVADESG